MQIAVDGGTVTATVEWAVATDGSALSHSDGSISEEQFCELIGPRGEHRPSRQGEDPRVRFTVFYPETEEPAWLAVVIERPVARGLRISCYCMPFSEIGNGAVSYRELYVRLQEVQVSDPPRPVQVAFSVQGSPSALDGSVHTAASGLRAGRPVCITGAEMVPLEARLQFCDAVASSLPGDPRLELPLDTWANGDPQAAARLYFSDRPQPDALILRWGELASTRDVPAPVKGDGRPPSPSAPAASPLPPLPTGAPSARPDQVAFAKVTRINQSPLTLLLSGDRVRRVLMAAVRQGLLAFNSPAEMRQGRAERVEVGIGNTPELRDLLVADLRGRGEPVLEKIRTSSRMRVELRGEAFVITAYSAVEQVVAPTARWEFDVLPRKAGVHTLTLCICMLVPGAAGNGDGLISEPVVERSVRVHVNVPYGTKQFVGANWQWLIATAAGLAGGISAWIELVH